VGVPCFTEELRIGFGADTTGTLSAGLDAEVFRCSYLLLLNIIVAETAVRTKAPAALDIVYNLAIILIRALLHVN
jgi:hypothetical protein